MTREELAKTLTMLALAIETLESDKAPIPALIAMRAASFGRRIEAVTDESIDMVMKSPLVDLLMFAGATIELENMPEKIKEMQPTEEEGKKKKCTWKYGEHVDETCPDCGEPTVNH